MLLNFDRVFVSRIQMCVETLLCFKLLPAFVTFQFTTFIVLRTHMRSQIPFLGKHSITNVTLEGFLSAFFRIEMDI